MSALSALSRPAIEGFLIPLEFSTAANWGCVFSRPAIEGFLFLF
jgi:hypothetical protein